ncbi:MAG: hypothetical protein ACI85N_002386 [Gammaproteobacteria bacterium]|jgi:hypothetical protein
MKKLLIAFALFMTSTASFAASPGGPNCGWGNLLLEGSSGKTSHVIAATTNASTGNATFGMTSGTNGCNTSDKLTYSGRALAAIPGFMEAVAQDMAKGEGEALDALALSYEIQDQADKAAFAKVMQQSFEQVFNQENISSEAFLHNIEMVMKNNAQLKKYAA